jgi:hypothetical protein
VAVAMPEWALAPEEAVEPRGKAVGEKGGPGFEVAKAILIELQKSENRGGTELARRDFRLL